VIATSEAVTDDLGAVTAVRGVFVDLTETLRRQQAAEVTRAVQQSAATRASIDQAKGVLMACFDLTDAQAFDLPRLHSSYANVRLRDVAGTLVQRLTQQDLIHMPARLRVASSLSTLAGGRVPDLPAPASTSDGRPTVQQAPVARGSASRQLGGATVAAALSPEFPVATLVHAIDDAGLSITIADCRADDRKLVYVNSTFVELTRLSGRRGLRPQLPIPAACRHRTGGGCRDKRGTGPAARKFVRSYGIIAAMAGLSGMSCTFQLSATPAVGSLISSVTRSTSPNGSSGNGSCISSMTTPGRACPTWPTRCSTSSR
jgi:hypothetical protein